MRVESSGMYHLARTMETLSCFGRIESQGGAEGWHAGSQWCHAGTRCLEEYLGGSEGSNLMLDAW
jgi:hypothetical protein